MIISWNGFSVTFNILNFSIISIFVLYLFFKWVCCHIYWVMVGNPRHCADYIPTHWTFFVFIWGRAKPSKSSTGWAKNHHAFTQKQLRPTRRHINVIIQPAIPMPHKTPQLTNLCIIRWKGFLKKCFSCYKLFMLLIVHIWHHWIKKKITTHIRIDHGKG